MRVPVVWWVVGERNHHSTEDVLFPLVMRSVLLGGRPLVGSLYVFPWSRMIRSTAMCISVTGMRPTHTHREGRPPVVV